MKNNNLSSQSLCIFFTGALTSAVSLLSSQVSAQEIKTGDVPISTVEVAGSNIPRINTETSSPMQIISADDIKKNGYTSVAQILQNIPANTSGTSGQNASGAFSAENGAISLRGLSSAATLILIDGHRVIPDISSNDIQRTLADVISKIPVEMLDRIEVLKDGASAIFGSDAIAGVVNLILKKNFTGTTVTTEDGNSTQGGGATRHLFLVSGTGSLIGGYSAFASIDYRQKDAVEFRQRANNGSWTRTDWSSLGGINASPGAPNQANGGLPATQTPYLINPLTNAISAAPGVNSCSTAQIYTNACTSTLHGDLIPETQSLALLAGFGKRLSNGWLLDVKVSAFDSSSTIHALGNGTPFPSSGFYTGAIAGGANIPVSGGVGATPVTYNGMDIGGVIPDSPNPGSAQMTARNYRLVVGLTGNVGDWKIDSSAGYTRNQINANFTGLTNFSALQAALNSTTTPFSFAPGVNSSALRAAIFPTSTQNDIANMAFAEIHANHSLMTLAGGELALSTGASYNYLNVNFPDSSAAIYGTASGAPTVWAVGSQSDVAAFSEFFAPVSKTFELDGAAHFDHFNDGSGNATTPKLGFKWTPTTAFALRGTVSTGFRAPDPSEKGNAGSVTSAGNIAYPVLCQVTPGGALVPGSVPKFCNSPLNVYLASNPDLQAEKSVSETLGIIVEPIKNWYSTLDLYQIKIKNKIVPGSPNANTLTYGLPENQSCFNGTGNTPCGPGQGYNLFTPWFASASYSNIQSSTTSGIELNTSYRFDLGSYGTLNAMFDMTHIMSYIESIDGVDYQLAGSHGPTSTNADTAQPKNKIHASVSYARNDWSVTTSFNWVDGYSLLDPTPQGNSTTSCAKAGMYSGWFPTGNIPSNYCQVSSFLDTDLTVLYKASDKLNLHMGIMNIFNRQPPVDFASYIGKGLPYNSYLHAAGVMGRFINLGLSYRF